MRTTVQANETADGRQAGAATYEGTLNIGLRILFVGNPIRRARLRSHVAGKAF
jgi:hypothetical protein